MLTDICVRSVNMTKDLLILLKRLCHKIGGIAWL